MVIAIAAVYKLGLTQLGIETAFLAQPIDREILIHRPDGFDDVVLDGYCISLHKSLYGLVQSPFLFSRGLDAHLRKIGFKQLQSDPCIYIRRRSETDVTIIGCVVDDMIVAHSRPVDTLVKELEQRYSMSNEGTLKF